MPRFPRARLPRRALAVALSLPVLGIAAAPASAGTLTTVAVAGGQQLKFTAAAGDADNLYWAINDDTNVYIEERWGQTIALGAGTAGCVRDEKYENGTWVDDPATAICPLAGITELNVVLSDQDDIVMIGSSLPSTLIDRVDGGAGDDTIDDQPGGRSVVYGGPGYDDISTYEGNDTINGESGNDDITTGEGNDTASGGLGDDDISTSSRRFPADTTTLNGNEGDDRLSGWQGTDKLFGDDGHDLLKAFGGNDTLTGGEGDDRMDGDVNHGDDRPGADVFWGGPGVDTADYSSRQEHAVNVNLDGLANDGQSGELDKVGADVENIDGGSKADVLTGDGAVNTINGNGDNDTINGGPASDYLNGSWGLDQINGGTGDDDIDGSSDDDTLDGGDGQDDIHGGTGDDDMFGSDGHDVLRADDGFDDVDGGPGLDNIDAGPGNDTTRTRDDVQDQVACSGGADLAYLDHTDVTDGACAYPLRAAGAKVDLAGNTLVYEAGAGAANNVNVTLASGQLTFTDSGAAISPGTGCTAVNANTVKCAAAPVWAIHISTGDFGDTLKQSAKIATRFAAGPGNDTVHDSPGPDRMFGNDGNDTFHQAATTVLSGGDSVSGGDGLDIVSYATRTTAVAVSLDSLRNDGADADGNGSGEEGDWVRMDVENVTGGTAADWLRGSDVGNTLNGGGGADRLSGGIGKDKHNGDAGADIINSRDGNADAVTCGTEADQVTADTVDTATADCERVVKA